MSNKQYDVVVIGSGPGGYICAIRCAQLGMKTAIIEKYNKLGGTCGNVGCIPSKALLDSSEHYHNAEKNFATHGIKTNGLKLDFKQMMSRKTGVVDQLAGGVEYLMKKNKIDLFTGVGSFENEHTILVTKSDKSTETLEAKNIVIATGSKPNVPASFGYDKKKVITSTEALSLTKLPKKMVVVGGGVIGLELGSVYARLGTEVIVVEFMDSILGTMDKDCGKELARSLKKLGMSFHLKHKVESIDKSSGGVKVNVSPVDAGEAFSIDADYCLVAIGRKPYTDGLGLEKISIPVDERGRIQVDGHLRTTHSHIYAIGDVIQGAMLAHKAEEEGVFVAETLAGQIPHIDYNLIPGVVYTWPEVSAVGKTESELKDAGIPYKKGKFPFKALGRAQASMDTEGFVKVLAHADTDEILGVHIVGARAADLIMEATTIMEFKGAAEDIGRICHPHPTFSEAIKEASLQVHKRALNF